MDSTDLSLFLIESTEKTDFQNPIQDASPQTTINEQKRGKTIKNNPGQKYS